MKIKNVIQSSSKRTGVGTLLVLLLLLVLPVALSAQSSKPLHGQWYFALDPVKVGEQYQWYRPEFSHQQWDKVTVPHSFTVDPRYHYYTGTTWYIRKFDQPKLAEGQRAFIRFDAVFYKAKTWLNGQKIGEHEGGYTPFEFDITDLLDTLNTLAVQVNNAWDTTTIPGAKTRVPYQGENISQLYPWMNYGGITRDVHIIIRPDVFIQKVKIEADPDLGKKTAQLKITASIKNKRTGPLTHAAIVNVYDGNKKVPVKFKSKNTSMPGGGQELVLIEGTMGSKDVKLWHHDQPHLYRAEVIFGKDTFKTRFGIRKIEVQGTKLLLNGEPVRMGGCNRPLDYPGYGSMDPKEILDKDMILIKSGSMELSRISHYPVSTALLDWADEHGMLLISEAGNWQMTPKQMSDPVMRAKFQSQMQEMIERDWNHPSVIAWSVGNEYPSHTPEGKAWTKDMYEFSKHLDPSRLVTFASMIVFRDHIRKPEDEASQYVDFISANIYGGHLKHLKHIHEVYPDKPVYISEFGVRTDGVRNEQERVDYLRKAMDDFRQCEYVIGASAWTFNDYQSVFGGSNPNGYRPWGLVSPEREPRAMYYAWQEEFSPATLNVERNGSSLTVTVTARKDFPSYTLRNYKIGAAGRTYDIGLLKPGEQKVFELEWKQGEETVRLIKPGGFIIVEKNIESNRVN